MAELTEFLFQIWNPAKQQGEVDEDGQPVYHIAKLVSLAQLPSVLEALGLPRLNDNSQLPTFGDSGCNTSVPIGAPTLVSFANPEHFIAVVDSAPVLGPAYSGSVDRNDCDWLMLWIKDASHPEVPQTVDIECDGVIVAVVAAHKKRDDVPGGVAKIYGVEWLKPAQYRDGLAHTWRVRASGTSFELTYNVPMSLTCAAPPSGPYVLEYVPGGAVVLYEGGAAADYWLDDRMNDNSLVRHTGPVAIVVDGEAPAGLTYQAIQNGAGGRLQLAPNSISTNQTIKLEFRRQGVAGPWPFLNVQLINADCQRPAVNLAPALVWNVVQGGVARVFTSLDDANQTAGQYFDGTLGGATLSTFRAQMADYSVGTTVYLGLGTDCATVADGLYYLLDGNGLNTQLLAIQVYGGKIVNVRPSTYQTPAARPVGAENCQSYAKLTAAQYQTAPVVTIYEHVGGVVAGWASNVRAFNSPTEATSAMYTVGQAGATANFDLVRVLDPALPVGSVLYGHNSPPDGDFQRWPVEAGYWGINYTAPQGGNAGKYTRLQTNACGVIIARTDDIPLVLN